MAACSKPEHEVGRCGNGGAVRMKKAWMIKMSVLFVTVISCVLFVSACGAGRSEERRVGKEC